MTQLTSDRFKLPHSALRFLIPFFLSFAMSCIISLISTLKSVGWADFVVSHWAQSWMFSWCVAFPTVLILLPLVRRFATLFVRPM